jgi:hypothetical protein
MGTSFSSSPAAPSSSASTKAPSTAGPSKAPAPKPAAKRPAAPKISEADAALLSLKTQRNNLFDAAERNENVRTRLVEEAKRALALSLGRTVDTLDGATRTESERTRHKQKALALMRRAKHHETQVQSIQAMFDNIDTTIDALEAGEVHKRVVAALDTGKTQLQRLNHELRDAEKIMDDMREAVADAREITAHLTEPLDALKAEEENEAAEAELAALIGVTATTTTTKTTAATRISDPAVNSSHATAKVDELKVPSGPLVASPATDMTAGASPVAAAASASEEMEEEERNTTRQLVAA